MQEKRKKFWIVFSISILAVLSMSFIFGMITNLKSVSVEFRQRVSGETRLEENILEKVKEDGNFEYDKGLLFVNVNKSIESIEKNNPFVKVEQVIRKFPNKLNVYISERVPTCYVSDGNYYFILDKEFKVLDKIETNSHGNAYLKQNYLSAIYEIDYDFSQSNLIAGDFVTETEKMKLYQNIYSGVIGALESVSSVKSIVISDNEINITMKKDNISFDDGVVIKLEGKDDLKLKTFVAIELFEKIDKTKSAQVIKVRKIKEEGASAYYSAYLDEGLENS